ncbi:MAG: hypothetical protein NC416_18570 [Eubacterium sp.]|nr:hypothetical protein [Eubacterium sp.]
MSTLEKAIGLLREMPENKLEAVYMYIRFVDSQTDNNEGTSSSNIDSLEETSHKHENPTLAQKEMDAVENTVTEKHSLENTPEKRLQGFQGLMSFAGTLPEDFDYKKELKEI